MILSNGLERMNVATGPLIMATSIYSTVRMMMVVNNVTAALADNSTYVHSSRKVTALFGDL